MELRKLSFKRKNFKRSIILMAARWYFAYALSYRDIKELMVERGVTVDHSTVNRWVIEYALQLENEFRKKHKSQVGCSWCTDETYVKIKGQWHYLYCAVDKAGNIVDFYLSKTRDKPAAEAFFRKAIEDNMLPKKMVIDKSGANKAALDNLNVQLAFKAAKATLAGIELHHMLRKGQYANAANMVVYNQFYALAA